MAYALLFAPDGVDPLLYGPYETREAACADVPAAWAKLAELGYEGDPEAYVDVREMRGRFQ